MYLTFWPFYDTVILHFYVEVSNSTTVVLTIWTDRKINMNYKNIDPKKRNPLYPNALRPCDVHWVVPYRTIHVKYGDNTGVFRGKPFISKKFPFGPYLTAKIIGMMLENNKKFKGELNLTSAGIAQDNDSGKWNKFIFTIKNTPADLKLYQEWLDGGGDQIIKEAANLLDYNNSMLENFGVFDVNVDEDGVEI